MQFTRRGTEQEFYVNERNDAAVQAAREAEQRRESELAARAKGPQQLLLQHRRLRGARLDHRSAPRARATHRPTALA